MTVESVTNISDLDINNPAGGDSISEGDDHIRNIKRAIKNTFPNITDPVTATQDEINKLSDFVRTGNGVFASCKWNGTDLMYSHNVSSVSDLGNGGYKVFFKQPTDGFDHHYAVQATPIATNARPVMIQVTDQRADWVAFTCAEWDGGQMGAPVSPVGFYMTMVDMIQTEANANT
jgi:hypothetical protein